MPYEIPQVLDCTCKGKSMFSKSCICFEHNLSCADLCPCQAIDICQNVNTCLVAVTNIDDDENDDVWDFIFLFVPYESFLANEWKLRGL